MARPEHLFVFAYDVQKDSARTRVADLLDVHLSRVQLSVFEGRLSAAAAGRLAKRASLLIGPDDSLRVYCITEPGRRLSVAYGPRPLPEAHDFILL
jgi:CRISPR-associated protein Cas2